MLTHSLMHVRGVQKVTLKKKKKKEYGKLPGSKLPTIICITQHPVNICFKSILKYSVPQAT